MNRLIQITGLAVLGLGRLLSGAEASALTDAQREFFESRIRPVLAQECYECHSEATKAKGGLLLDSRSGWQKGGDSGPVIDLANPGASLLLRSLTHEIEDLKMPKNGAKLDAPVLVPSISIVTIECGTIISARTVSDTLVLILGIGLIVTVPDATPEP